MEYKKFYEFGISDALLSSLFAMGFEEPTPIQKIAIPLILKGRDIVGQAQTGTGKTAAFGIPIIEMGKRGKAPLAFVLVPTRELAVQVAQELNKIGKNKGILSVPIYGGQSIERQIWSLKKGVDIVVGTPGRVIDHIHRKTLVLKEIKVLVLDEADEMLNMGFIDDIEEILKDIPEKRQTLLFSATMPQEIRRIAMKYMKDPENVRVNTADMVVSKIKQVFYEVREEDKIKALTRLLDVEAPSLTLVFCHTKRDVDDVSGKLQQMGYYAGAIHGDFTQSHREETMGKFKRGDIDILVATDVAARGLDIPDVSHVINYSIPQDPDGYIHRIGRTGRAGKSGIAITFVSPREYRQLRLIEQSAKTKIKKAKLPTKEDVKKAREEEVIADIKEAIADERHTRYLHLADEMLRSHSSRDVAAAAFSIAFGDMEVDEIEEPAAVGSKTGFVRLFVTIGRKDKIKVADIVRSISAEANIPAKKIGNIALFDTFSFVEVPAHLADRVISTINDIMLHGRRVTVQHAKEKRTGAPRVARNSKRSMPLLS
ncbi:MAG TPA: DEAD/DEAH box helicase [Thermodesulfovibrionales bacterium]|jgi:ATP-dependent RNA helicase DeaD|nr:DEAD/DEAH box helicase [Thermodesulfovibrionales bacterium]